MKLFFLALILVSEYGWKQLLDGSFNYWGYRFIVQATILFSFSLFFRPSPLLFLVALGGAWLGTIELVEKHIKNQGFRCAWRLLCFGLLFGYGLFWQPIGNGIYFSLAKLIKPEIIAVFLLLGPPANYLIRTFLGKTDHQIQEDSQMDSQTLRAGRSIGMLERWLLVLLLLCGYSEGLAFVLAIKSLVRFRQFEQPHFAEYYLLGTMYSVFIALIAVVFLQRRVLKCI